MLLKDLKPGDLVLLLDPPKRERWVCYVKAIDPTLPYPIGITPLGYDQKHVHIAAKPEEVIYIG